MNKILSLVLVLGVLIVLSGCTNLESKNNKISEQK
jgi:outer membrane murein-binding lipoprotein Lpp